MSYDGVAKKLALTITATLIASAPAISQTKPRRHASMDYGSHCVLTYSPAESALFRFHCAVSNRLRKAMEGVAKSKEIGAYSFSLSPEGTVQSVQVYKSSGDRTFDQLAMHTIFDSGPYDDAYLSSKFLRTENLKLVVQFPSLQVGQLNF